LKARLFVGFEQLVATLKKRLAEVLARDPNEYENLKSWYWSMIKTVKGGEDSGH
jgi:hypothetical protein